MLKDKNSSPIVSFITLRRLIGILGMCLPFACLLEGSLFLNKPVLDSISAYYHSNMRDLFTGIIIGFSLFLLAYKGYEVRDTIISIASGIAGLGIAIFPCASRTDPQIAVGMFQLTPPIASYLHYGSSALFFLLLGINSFFLFTMSDKPVRTRSKNIRNGIYRICGLFIFLSLVILGILGLSMGDELVATSWTFVFETVMLIAFGISWLIKGGTIFADKPGEIPVGTTMVQNPGMAN